MSDLHPPTHEEIAVAAYYIYLNAGRLKGPAEWNWIQGEKQLWDRYHEALRQQMSPEDA